MRIEIDTKAKTVKIEDSVPLDQLIAELDKVLLMWRTYTLIPSVSNISYPVYPTYPTFPNWPTYEVYRVTCGDITTGSPILKT